MDRSEIAKRFARDRHYCTRTVLVGLEDAGACFIVREHANHPHLAEQGEWRACGRVETGLVREQAIAMEHQQAPWRRIELALDVPTENGDTTLWLWSNLPEAVTAGRIAELYRTRWHIEGMFGRLESVLHSELRSLGRPRAALLGFAAAVLAYNVLALLQRVVEQAHQPPPAPPSPAAPPPPAPRPPLEVSCFHLAVQVRGGYEGLLIALQPEHWPHWDEADPAGLAQHLLRLARNINPRQVATSKRGPKTAKPKGYVDGKTARAHVATARLLEQAKATP